MNKKIYLLILFSIKEVATMAPDGIWPKPHKRFDDKQLTQIVYSTQQTQYFSLLPKDVRDAIFNIVQSNHVRAEIGKYTPYFILTHTNPLVKNVSTLYYLWANLFSYAEDLMTYSVKPRSKPLIKEFEEENDVQTVQIIKDCALIKQTILKDLQAVKSLLDQGANPNKKAFDGGGTCMHAAAQLGHLDLITLFFHHGADIHQQTDAGADPLCIAAENNHKDAVNLLLILGANVNVKNRRPFGQTALYLACQNGHNDIAGTLLGAGAEIDPTVLTPDGFLATPLFKAVEHNHLKVVQTLLSAGANVNWSNAESSALHFAANNQNWSMMKALLKARGIQADVWHSIEKSTPLHFAAQAGEVELVKLLLAAGAKDRASKDGITSLMLAAQHNYIKIAEKLLAAGSNPNLKNSCGLKAIDYAQSIGHSEMVTLLNGE